MFTSLDIKRLVDAADLPDFGDPNSVLPLLSGKERNKKIHRYDSEYEREVAAAIEIQRIWRGYRTRKILFAILCPSEAAVNYLTSNSTSPTYQDIRSSLNSSPVSNDPDSSLVTKSTTRTLSSYRSYVDNIEQKEKMKKLLSFQDYAASTIQSWWRVVREKSSFYASTFKSQETEKTKLSSKSCTEFDAAIVIQKSWRRHIDMQVFQYYKQLINFYNQGNPHFMLKCINPKEAGLLDSAAGVHIRFRMGGMKFPPNIYYKIFTHINVADVGAFSPRNYVNSSTKLLPGKFIHNRGFEILGDESNDWYERYENNGWRLVSDRVMKYLNQDPVVYETSKSKIDFNHEKLLRKQDLALKRKKKKINWMKKMYQSGMLNTSSDKDSNVNDLVEAAAKGIFMIADEAGPENVEDWEVDELLEWTSGLNFDTYLKDWQQCGTTSLQVGFSDEVPKADPLVTMVQENT